MAADESALQPLVRVHVTAAQDPAVDRTPAYRVEIASITFDMEQINPSWALVLWVLPAVWDSTSELKFTPDPIAAADRASSSLGRHVHLVVIESALALSAFWYCNRRLLETMHTLVILNRLRTPFGFMNWRNTCRFFTTEVARLMLVARLGNEDGYRWGPGETHKPQADATSLLSTQAMLESYLVAGFTALSDKRTMDRLISSAKSQWSRVEYTRSFHCAPARASSAGSAAGDTAGAAAPLDASIPAGPSSAVTEAVSDGAASAAAPATTLLDLPDEILLRLLSFLPIASTIVVRGTCRRLRLLAEDASLYRSIDVYTTVHLHSDELGPSYCRQAVPGWEVPERVTLSLFALPFIATAVRSLCLHHCDVTEALLIALVGRLPHLAHLDIGAGFFRPDISSRVCRWLLSLPLQSVNLAYCQNGGSAVNEIESATERIKAIFMSSDELQPGMVVVAPGHEPLRLTEIIEAGSQRHVTYQLVGIKVWMAPTDEELSPIDSFEVPHCLVAVLVVEEEQYRIAPVGWMGDYPPVMPWLVRLRDGRVRKDLMLSTGQLIEVAEIGPAALVTVTEHLQRAAITGVGL